MDNDDYQETCALYEVGPYLKTGRYLLYTFNGIFFAFASVLFSICMWIRWDPSIDDYIREVGFVVYFRGIIVIMVGCIILMIACFLAWCGTWYWSFRLLLSYILVSLFSFLLNLSGAVFLLYITLSSNGAVAYIEKRFGELIYQYHQDVLAKRSVDIIQELMGCCGAYSTGDYDVFHMPYPNSCRDPVTGNNYSFSCAIMLTEYLEVRTGWVAGIALCICFLQFFSGVFVVCMCRGISERKEAIKASFGYQ